MKKTHTLSKILRYSWQQQIQNIKLFKHYTEKDKIKIWTELSSLGQESTIKIKVYSFTMPGPLVELMTRENLISRE